MLQKVIVCYVRCKASASMLYVYVLVACNLKSKFRWHCLVNYWLCYYMFRNIRTKVFPRVAWPGLMAGNVTEWCQRMSGYFGVAYLSLKFVGGIVIVWYQSLNSTLSLDGPEECNRSEYSQKSNFEVTRIRIIECPWKRLAYWHAW